MSRRTALVYLTGKQDDEIDGWLAERASDAA